jgi:hypothetical protein
MHVEDEFEVGGGSGGVGVFWVGQLKNLNLKREIKDLKRDIKDSKRVVSAKALHE